MSYCPKPGWCLMLHLALIRAALRDRHRPSRACHSPANARLIMQNIGKPCCTEAGDEAVDADLQFVAVADRRAEGDQDSAVPNLPAAASGLNHGSPDRK